MDTPVEVARFPRDIELFNDDHRISYDQTKETHILEDEIGREWQWHAKVGAWSEVLDEALIAQQQEAYKMPGVDENTPAVEPKKRKAQEEEFDPASGMMVKKQKQKPDAPKKERVNTAVFVKNLPDDVTIEEICREFVVAGIIAEGLDDGKPRVKTYYRKDGSFDGSALIVFFRPESVVQAITLFDGMDFRFGAPHPAGVMSVEEATSLSWSEKQEQQDQQQPGEEQRAKKKKATSTFDRKKAIKKNEEMNSRLSDWPDDEPPPFVPEPPTKTVVLKHMFTLEELASDPYAAIDIFDEIKEACESFGAVTKVVLFDLEEDGIVTVKFEDEQAAKAAVQKFDGTSMSGRKVIAFATAAKQKFKKAKVSEEEEAKRLEQFAKDLEGEE